MAAHNVSESDAFTTNVQMPSDGDPADASDLESTTIVPLANRSRWLKIRVDQLLAFLAGGAATLANDLVYTIALGKTLTIKTSEDLGAGDSTLDLTRVLIKLSGNLYGPLCPDASNGRLPHKIAIVTSSQDINPILRNYYDCTPTANISLTINLGSETLVPGDHFWILNRSTSYTITVLLGFTPIINVPAAEIGIPACQEVVWNGASWVYGRRIV